MAKSPEPLKPPSRTNPIGGTREIKRTTAIINRHLASVRTWLLGELGDIPTEIVGNRVVTAKRFEYLISLTDLRRIVSQLDARMKNKRMMERVTARATAAYA